MKKHLIVSVAGLGWRDLKQRGTTRIAGLDFTAAEAAFPALTCVAQASLRTGAKPKSHGMTSNGHFSRDLRRPFFWEQSSTLVRGPRIWDKARGADESLVVGLLFFQQSMGEPADLILTPAPIHKHHGGMINGFYSQPADLADEIHRSIGRLNLRHYWGPAANPVAGDLIVSFTEAAIGFQEPDIAFTYLPTLDYDLQRHGPDHPVCENSFLALERQLEQLAQIAEDGGYELVVIGEYGITQVTEAPAFPNVTLRKAGHLKVRDVNGMAYPDFHASRAFALCDHEIAHVYVQDPDDIDLLQFLFERDGAYDKVERRDAQPWAHPSAGELLLTAKKGSWCAYPWWENKREAPEYATHVDIHNKPGYDPCELFLGGIFPPRTSLDATRIRGTHGRDCEVAFATSIPLPSLPPFPSIDEIGASLARIFATHLPAPDPIDAETE